MKVKENAYKKSQLSYSDRARPPSHCLYNRRARINSSALSSDSEFAAGPIKHTETIIGKTKSNTKRNVKLKRDSDRPAKKRKVQWSDSEDKKWMASVNTSADVTNKSEIYRKNAIENPLAKYFVEIDDESDDDADDEMQSADDDNDGGEDMEIDEGEELAHIPKTMAAFLSMSNTRPPQTSTSVQGNTADVEESSHTEDDSSHTEDDSSHTESDSAPPLSTTMPIQNADSSDTEDDPEFELELQQGNTSPQSNKGETDEEMHLSKTHPKPGFQPPKYSVNEPFLLNPSNNIKVPSAINMFLRDYQRHGVKFFYERYKAGRGGLLGDDMGLGKLLSLLLVLTPLPSGAGKTVQVIAFLSAIMGKSGFESDEDRRRNHVRNLQNRPEWRKNKKLPSANATWPTCLIVAPSSVVHNWERELQTWGYFEVGVYTAPPKERAHVLKDFKFGRLDIVLTSFDIALKDIDLLDNLKWSCIFVDEVHRVKNLSSRISLALHRFECLCRFGLTGTAIQNSYDELHSILHWTNPARLGLAKHWKSLISKPLRRGQSSTATDEEKAKALIISDTLVRKLLPEFFLRRTKELIKDQLPTKTDIIVFCPLAATQLAAYKRILQKPEVQHLIEMNDPCECGSGHMTKLCCHPYKKETTLRYMTVLLQLSNHLGLILPNTNQKPEQLARNRELAKWIFPHDNMPNRIQVEFGKDFCGKWRVLETLLQEIRQDRSNKVLIFTKSVQLLKIIQNYLETQRKRKSSSMIFETLKCVIAYKYCAFSGETPQKDRMGLIDEFHSNPEIFVFLISTLAGGTGLNLTGANHVVIFDPHWNPAHDLQAMDRAYRIGQTRPVKVYRLLGAGALEELIYNCQVYKQQQMRIGYEASIQTRYFEGVKNDPQKRGELFGLKNIFRLDEKKIATKTSIEEANQAQLDWAFANVDTKGVQGDSNDLENMAGLDDFVMEDSIKSTASVEKEESKIEKIFETVGITYTHDNAEILQQNEIEVEKAKELLKKLKATRKRSGHSLWSTDNDSRSRSSSRRQSRVGNVDSRRQSGKRKSTGATAEHDEPKAQWPPVRKHHRPKLTPQEQAEARYEALIDLELIQSFADIKEKLVPQFLKSSFEEQKKCLRVLDEHKRQMDKDKLKAAAARRAKAYPSYVYQSNEGVHSTVNASAATSYSSLDNRTYGQPPEQIDLVDESLSTGVLELAAHYGIPQSLPAPPRANLRPPENPATQSSSFLTDVMPDFEALRQSYLKMLSNAPSQDSTPNAVPEPSTAPSSSQTQTRPLTTTSMPTTLGSQTDNSSLQPILDLIQASSEFRVPTNFLTSPYTPSPYFDDFNTSPMDDSPFMAGLNTPIMDHIDDFEYGVVDGSAWMNEDGVAPLFKDASLPYYAQTAAQRELDEKELQEQPAAAELNADKLYTFSPSSPLLESFHLFTEPVHSPSVQPALSLYPAPRVPTSELLNPPARATSRSRSKSRGPSLSANGIRRDMTSASMVPLDAPTQPRKYVLPSSTSRKANPVHAQKRTHSQAFGEQEQDELVGEIPPEPDATEVEHIAWKRRQNTIAARKTRRRKLEYVQRLEAEKAAEKEQSNRWRVRCGVLEDVLKAHGIMVPAWDDE
ncbi:P-loop containing nucleoside triphosphate hydrolase protein [Lentinula aciculospora]|uniref:P-loop containing nucleoside triphosphate hydrolase protein n=1 Tax=Lentinula aciculospora TaxID=153920 RepID=A0A9W9AHI1_9AGAR|nr:P-loop containing nucleoside triphosphate hydrolase protein [Lentinula aciculospora]